VAVIYVNSRYDGLLAALKEVVPMDASRARQRLREIAGQREQCERVLVEARGPLVAGSLVERFTKCRRAGCKCMRGEPHGPFLYLSRNEDGRTRWFYIGKATEGPLALAAKRYKTFAEALRTLRKLEREAEDCYAVLEAALAVEPRTLVSTRKGRKS